MNSARGKSRQVACAASLHRLDKKMCVRHLFCARAAGQKYSKDAGRLREAVLAMAKVPSTEELVGWGNRVR